MKFLQDLILAIFMPRKSRPPVSFKLTQEQQRQVLKGCSEINALIQEVHANLSDIRQAGSNTSHLTKQSHRKNLEGRKSLRQQQQECERINGELKKIAEDMRAVRENVALSSQKTFLTFNRAKTLDRKVMNMSASADIAGQSHADTTQADIVLFPARENLPNP